MNLLKFFSMKHQFLRASTNLNWLFVTDF